MLRTFLLWSVILVCDAQINVQVQILNGTQDSLDQNTLNQQLFTQNLSSATIVASSEGSLILIQQCGVGTYAEGSSTTCTACPAGTASNIIGATTRLTCQTCSPGNYSFEQAAVCSQCPLNTFSPNAGAPEAQACMNCPPNTAAPLGNDMITKCACNDRYFIPTNTLQVLDPVAPVQFGSWASLPINTFLVNSPHLAC